MTMQLGDLQQLAMLAVARLRQNAFGGTIRDELERVAGRRVSVGTVYVTLVRLESQGLVESEREEVEDPPRAGKPRRYFRLTPDGWAALVASREALDRMWEGVQPVR